MELSKSLISEFVKTTKDDTTTKKESIVYGTIYKDESTGSSAPAYVKIDGSDVLIPVSETQATSAIHENDRVTVMIKDHKAIVTGNLTKPSTTQIEVDGKFETITSDYATMTYVEAVEARINDIVSANITTEYLDANYAKLGDFTAVSGDVESLKTDKASVEQLNAAVARIETLEAKDIDTETLDARYAKITDLESNYAKMADLTAVQGDITSLNSEVANIDTLIFGSASGTTIQSSFANAVIAQLGNAAIKSAMIESVSADKIMSGDIITNNVKVKSSDGKLVISDETLQISDGSRVRVQIGKDDSNDYSISIWDQNGNLMFSKGGITDNAIKNAIIRNSMISDDANISAHKLDIDSLFEEINDSSKTIKASKVKLNEQGQTLDVEFTTLTTEVNNTKTTVSSQGTAIQEVQGQISSKIWQQDIDTAVDGIDTGITELSTKYNTIEQTINGIRTTVESHSSQLENMASDETITAIREKVTTLEQDVDGIKSTVKSTYATKKELANVSNIATVAANKANAALTTANNALDTATNAETTANNTQSAVNTLTERVTTSESSITQLSNKITSNVTTTNSLLNRTSTLEQTADGLTIQLTNVGQATTNAAKTATNFLSVSNEGLIVADMSNISEDEVTVDLLPGTKLKNGDTIIITVTDGYTMYTGTDMQGSNGEYFYFYPGGAAGSCTYGWNYSGVPWDAGDGGYGAYFPCNYPGSDDGTQNLGTYTFVYTGMDCTITSGTGVDSIRIQAKTTAEVELKNNLLLSPDKVSIRNGETVYSTFSADLIELAKDNESAIISMLNGAFKIYYGSDSSEKGYGIYGRTSSGEERLAFQPINENDNLTIGWGGYSAGANSTNIYGHNIKLIAGNDMSIDCEDWKINIDGNLFARASDNSFIELIGLSNDDNTAIGHGGYTSAMGKTNIYGNKINHIVNTTTGSASYKPYYEAGDTVEIEWYGAGFISSSSKVVYFTIPLAKPIIGGTTPEVVAKNSSTNGGLRVRQNGNYVFGAASNTHVSPASYKAQVSGEGNIVRIEATMPNATNAINNTPCGIDAHIKLTFS
jgi:hypothetical protein